MGRYNVNEPKKLTKTFLEAQKTVSRKAEFQPDTIEHYWKLMTQYHSPAQIAAMKKVGCKRSYDDFIENFLTS